MSAYAKGDAVRLLRAIDVEQAHGRVGASVFAFAAARSAGLRPGTERYEEALWHLVWEGALTVDEHVPMEVAAVLPFGRGPYRLAPAAMRMLARAYRRSLRYNRCNRCGGSVWERRSDNYGRGRYGVFPSGSTGRCGVGG